MICPICKKNTAYLWHEDGITKAGKNIIMSIMCGGVCQDKNNSKYGEPEEVGTIEIDVIIKRGSLQVHA